MSRNPLTLSQVRSLAFLRNSIIDLVDSLAKAVSSKSRRIVETSTQQTSDLLSSKPTNDPPKELPTNLNESKSDKSPDEFVKEQESAFEKAISEWAGAKSPEKVPATNVRRKAFSMSTSSHKIESRSRELARLLATAVSPTSQLLRLEEVCYHLMQFPQAKGILVRERTINMALRLRDWSNDASVRLQACEALSLLGYCDPPRGSGIRILSIDGGGTRGMVAIEILRHLEAATGLRVAQLFDFICGVSTGAILAMLLGARQSTLDECEDLYRKMSKDIFNRNTWIGTGRLVWSHAYYDTSMWESMLRKALGEELLIETARNCSTPKLAAISVLMNQPTLQAFVFRNYALPYRSQSQYPGSNQEKIWEAVRASAAAPGYFEEFYLNNNIHQDGGVMLNNPTALAIHEAKLLWPREEVSCIISLGNGRYVPPTEIPSTSTSLKTKVLKFLDSATDTEGVHWTVHDLLPPSIYYRLNPYLTEPITLDENRPEKLEQLKMDAQMYVRKNKHKVLHAAETVMRRRSRWCQIKDWVRLQGTLRQY